MTQNSFPVNELKDQEQIFVHNINQNLDMESTNGTKTINDINHSHIKPSIALDSDYNRVATTESESNTHSDVLASPIETPIPHISDSPSPFPNEIPSPFPSVSPNILNSTQSPFQSPELQPAISPFHQTYLQSPFQSPIPNSNGRTILFNDQSSEVITPSPRMKKSSKSNLSIRINSNNEIDLAQKDIDFFSPKTRTDSSSLQLVKSVDESEFLSPNVLSHSLDSGGYFSGLPPIHSSRSPKTAINPRKYAEFPAWEGFQADIDEYQKQSYRASTTAMDLFNIGDRKDQHLKRRASIANISSFSPMPLIQDTSPEVFEMWCDHKLKLAKRETDQDIKIFSFELRQTNIASLNVILNICSEILSASVLDLRQGKYESILYRLRELNSSADAETKKYARKLMFIFSKCSRLLLYIRKQRDSLRQSQENDDDNFESPRKQKKRSATVFQPSSTDSLDKLNDFKTHHNKTYHPRILSNDSINREDTIPQSKMQIVTEQIKIQPEDQQLKTQPISINKQKKQDTPSKSIETPLTSPGKQFWSKLLSTFKNFKSKNKEITKKELNTKYDDSSSSDSQAKNSGKPNKKNFEIFCRVCEELINISDLVEHSKTCSMRHDIENRLNTADERLKRLAISIDKRIEKSAASKESHLSEVDIRILRTLEDLARSVSQLTYTPHSIAICEALLNEAINIREQSLNNDENQNSRRRVNTVQVFSQRIAEVIKQKFDDMQKRQEIPGVKDQPELLLTKPSIKDFDILKPISRGAFGTVYLAIKKKTNDLFAIKVLKKEQLKRRKQTERVLAERNIMAIASSEFIVNFYYSFQGQKNFYIVMEYCRGGDVFSLLQKHLQDNQAFSIEMAKQFISETILALKHLHSHNIVHRDLKPDNILICSDGHIKLTDFGLSELGLIDLDPLYAETVISSPILSPNGDRSRKFGDSIDKEAERFRGTPDYLAPEILLGEEHSTPVDWWAVGILLFEFLYGCPPFNSDTPSEIFDNILSLNIPWPPRDIDDTPKEAIDLIEKLLVIDPKKRLGANGAEEVMNHPFFKDVDWVNLRKIRPHFVPELNDEDDIGCFSPRQRIYPVSSSIIEDDGISPPKVSDGYSPVNHSGSFEDATSPFSNSIDFSYIKTHALAELTIRDREKKMMQNSSYLGDYTSEESDHFEHSHRTELGGDFDEI